MTRVTRAALACALVLLGAAPLLVARPGPLQDWPNHVARVHIVDALLRGDEFWPRFYALRGFLVPDAALDLGVLGLMRAGLPIAAAAQAFLCITYLAFVGGFCGLARASGALGPAKLGFAILLFYCNALFWGLVGYMLGLGLMLGILALWLSGGTPLRLVVAALGAALLLFAHVVPAVEFAVVLGCFDAHRFATSSARFVPRVIASASWLVAASVVAALLHVLPGGTGHDFVLRYAGGMLGGFLAWKISLFGKLLLGGSTLQDAASLLALAICVGAGLAARARLPAAAALAVAALAALTLAAPERLGTGSLLDVRLAVVPIVLAAACVRLERRPALGLLVNGAVLLRTAIVAAQFLAAGQVFRDFDRLARDMPAGSVMMMAYGTPLDRLTWRRIWSPPVQSIATQAVLRDVVMPAIFANPAQQPIELRPEWRDLTQPWNVTDAAHLRAAAASLARVCAARAFPRVYLTVLYPGSFVGGQAAAALLAARPDFLILDACRLPP